MRWDLSAGGEAVITKCWREGKNPSHNRGRREGGGRSCRVEIMGGKSIAGERRKDNTERPLGEEVGGG